MTKMHYIPILIGDTKVGTAMIENGRLQLQLPDNRLRLNVFGEAKDQIIDHISITDADDPNVCNIHIHYVESE